MISQYRFVFIFSFLIVWQAFSLIIGKNLLPSVVDVVSNIYNILK
jgi:hypothetical protein